MRLIAAVTTYYSHFMLNYVTIFIIKPNLQYIKVVHHITITHVSFFLVYISEFISYFYNIG